MNYVLAWVKASRLASQSYIFLPILMGQAVWVAQGGKLNLTAFFLVQLFGLFDQLYIVYANDYADQASDLINGTPTMFSGGSRVLVEGLLKPVELKIAAILMVILCLLCGILFSVLFGYHLMTPLMSVGILLLWMYSYRPFRQSYRGGGEILQTSGTGLLLPLIGYYAQSGTIDAFFWSLLLIVLPTSLSCAIATALPDYPSDTKTSKRTIPVLIGLKNSKIVIMALNLLSIVIFYFSGFSIQNSALAIVVYLIPAAALLGMVPLIKAMPGDSRMTGFVAIAVLTTLSLIGAVTASLLGY
ncbi:MAG: prenyltransferase [Chitinispirillaceae bacterium]|nr:prenyltransferase [Chitinispirillaceae bacterium]